MANEPIPDEAVEAAAKVIALSTGAITESDWEWEHLPKDHYYKTARAALEAATPHILKGSREAVALFLAQANGHELDENSGPYFSKASDILHLRG